MRGSGGTLVLLLPVCFLAYLVSHLFTGYSWKYVLLSPGPSKSRLESPFLEIIALILKGP